MNLPGVESNAAQSAPEMVGNIDTQEMKLATGAMNKSNSQFARAQGRRQLVNAFQCVLDLIC